MGNQEYEPYQIVSETHTTVESLRRDFPECYIIHFDDYTLHEDRSITFINFTSKRDAIRQLYAYIDHLEVDVVRDQRKISHRKRGISFIAGYEDDFDGRLAHRDYNFLRCLNITANYCINLSLMIKKCCNLRSLFIDCNDIVDHSWIHQNLEVLVVINDQPFVVKNMPNLKILCGNVTSLNAPRIQYLSCIDIPEMDHETSRFNNLYGYSQSRITNKIINCLPTTLAVILCTTIAPEVNDCRVRLEPEEISTIERHNSLIRNW